MKCSFEKNSYFKLFSNCRIIEGASSSAIYDLQREELFQIPNSFLEILNCSGSKKIEDIYSKYPKESETLDEYFGFLLSNDLILLMPELKDFEQFKEIDFTYYYPFSLFSVITALDNNKLSISYIENLLNNIEATQCKYVQLRFGLGIDPKLISDTIKLFVDKGIFRSISVFLSQNDYKLMFNDEYLTNSLIDKLTIYSSNNRYNNINEKSEFKPDNVEYIEESDFPVFKNVNELRFKHFQPNIFSYSEAQNYNIYYNKKAYINPNGDIQQSPFTNKVFGNIKTKSLLSIISNQTFQEYWDIPKDKIEVCKDCEFRYVCNDGRIPIKRDDETYYFEESCTYDPYKN